MQQQTLAMANGFEQYAKKTRRALFLEEMEQVVPWAQLCRLIEPHYPKAGKGRPPVGLERMLRVYFLQQWFNLSDPGLEEALYDSVVMRQFVGIDLGQSQCRTKPQCASSVTCWKSTAWAERFCRR
jgi:IS5 family transposase